MGSHSRTGHEAWSAHGDGPGYSPVPSLVQWMTTLDCDLHCPHCLAVERGASVEAMSTAMALGLVDQVANAGVDELLLTGGEPLSRRDLPEIVEHAGARGVSVSLNTARLPRGAVQRAFEMHPPKFVAVSLDGPERVHDEFRGMEGAYEEALESMRFFRSIGSRVAAGTTVTRRNLPYLTETLGIVERSAAHTWGLHLLVPEGRARCAPHLQMSQSELRRVVRFVEEKRNYVSVEMADELGFCGDREPLLRDLPLSCGAGRMQCVVLPDGEVVPCTTLDRSASAGNIHDRPLLDIWRDGFSELRRARPRMRCRGCDYFSACGGGCWLQTREHARCFVDVWGGQRRGLGARGLVVALGVLGASCGSCGPATQGRGAHAEHGDPSDPSRDERTETGEPPATPEEAAAEIDTDPIPAEAAAPLMVSGPRGANIDLNEEAGGPLEAVIVRLALHGPSQARVEEIASVRPTTRASDPGWSFVESYAQGRLPTDLASRLAAVRAALHTQERSLALGALLYRSIAEPLLGGPRVSARSSAERQLLRDTLEALRRAVEAWRRRIFDGRLDPYLARGRTHLPRRFMMLKSMPMPPPEMTLARDTLEERWGREGTEALEGWLLRHPYAEALALTLVARDPGLATARASGPLAVGAEATFGVHDVLLVPANEVHASVRWEDGAPLVVTLPAGSEVTYIDLLVLVQEQHGAELERIVAGHGVIAGNPLLLPLMRDRADEAWLADFWLF